MKRNIGILHFKVGGTDGVSLEIDKWKQVLKEMGHDVFLCGGDLGTVDGEWIEEMYHHRPDVERLNHNTFVELKDYESESEYREAMYKLVDKIELRLSTFIRKHHIDFLIPNNIWSVGASPSVAIALARVVRDFNLQTIAHHHDFYWERVDGVALTCATAIEIADKYLPPRDPLIQHIVINSLGQKELYARKGIEATVVPNIFDFDAPAWHLDEYNQDFRQQIGLKKNDILILQATRIVPRKGIELAIDFVKTIDTPERRAKIIERGLYDGRQFDENSRIVLVLAGYAQDDLTGKYLGRLKEKIKQEKIDALFIDDIIGGRRELRDGKKVYALFDTYPSADFVTYPSLWEGWGNQLLETIRARLPFMLFEYPVYLQDIKESGFEAVSLGSQINGRTEDELVTVDQDVLEKAADQAVDLLTSAVSRQDFVETNFRVGKQYYSLDALRRYISELMAKFEIK